MGRPRKDQGVPDARQRLLDAFWTLLGRMQLKDLTVGAVASEAHCNRGTFYYHFTDLDDLIVAAIEAELLGENSVPNAIFNLLTGADDESLEHVASDQRMMRLSLIMKCGGADRVEAKAKSILYGMWRAVLCPDGGDLTQEARFVAEYAMSGMLGMLSFKCQADAEDRKAEYPLRFVKEVAPFILSQISEAQGISEGEILTRLKMLNQFMGFSKG